jgi:iron-sulfur cluster assembly protein
MGTEIGTTGNNGVESAQVIRITEIAAKRILLLMSKQNLAEGGLRVGVKGGGCSGLSYVFSWEKEARLGDQVFEEHGAKIFVDKKSFLFLKGTMLDYDTSLMSKGFVLSNPNAKASCGCGTSFSV